MLMRPQFITGKVERLFLGGRAYGGDFTRLYLLNIRVKAVVTPGLINGNVLRCNDKLEKGLI